MVVEVVIRDQDDLDRLRERLADLSPALRKMGEVLVSQAKRAFTAQGLPGEEAWKRRYPYQKSPHINVAGVVSDWNQGKEPPLRRFEARPAGIDTGLLSASPEVKEVLPLSTIVGSEWYSADTFQKGGVVSQPVLPETKTSIQEFLMAQPDYAPHLAGLLKDDVEELETSIVPRPFMGITEQNRKDFVEIVETFIAGGSDG